MLIAFATLLFLIALWLAAVVVLQAAAEDGAKVVAALKGRSLLAQPVVNTRPVVVRLTPRPRTAVRPVMRAEAQLRAAA